MDYQYVKPLRSDRLIDDFEKLTGYRFPKSFRNHIRIYNGGRPRSKTFKTDKAKRELKSFLSFNPDNKENVWNIREWNKYELGNKYVAFAVDDLGNMICFDKDNNHIIFLNHNNSKSEYISDTFTDFMDCLV